MERAKPSPAFLPIVWGLILTATPGCHLLQEYENLSSDVGAADTNECRPQPDATPALPEPKSEHLYARRLGARTFKADGALDEFGTRRLEIGSPDGGKSDNRMAIAALSSSDHLYLGVEVRDGSVETPSSSNPWNRDGIEVGWEPEASDGDSLSNRVKKWIITATGGLRVGRIRDGRWDEIPAPSGTEHAIAPRSTGYVVEIALPWSASTIAPDERDGLRVCVRNNDRDDGTVSRIGCRSTQGSFREPSTWSTLHVRRDSPCPTG